MLMEVKRIISERIQTNDEDDFNIEKCRNKLIYVLSQEYIVCLRDIEKKYPTIDISDSIEVAEEYI
jgi:uncharacterized protein YlaI